jgi:MarR family transcriptional regulator, organic hydroperoxide resistance regulator
MARAEQGTEAAARLERRRRNEGVLAMIRTADVVRRHFTRVFEPYGLTTQQYNVLRILRGARPQALPTMEIAARMMEQTPGITRLLDRLDEKGLITRERCAEDRRQVLCTISLPGLELLDELEPLVVEADDAVVARLAPADLEQLIRLLYDVAEGLE